MSELQLLLWEPASARSITYPKFSVSGDTPAGAQRLYSPEELGFTIISTAGLGTAPLVNHALKMSQGDGAIYRRTRAQQRVVSLGVQFLQNTFLDEQGGIAGLIDRLQQIWIRYGTRDLFCRYAGGLEGATQGELPEKAIIRFIADDPYWYDTTEQSQNILTNGTINNTGSAECFPILTLTGSGSFGSLGLIENQTTGYMIRLQRLEVLTGEIITINLLPNTKTVISSMRGNLIHRIDRDSNFAFDFSRWSLVPGSQLITVNFSMASIHIAWIPRHWGID